MEITVRQMHPRDRDGMLSILDAILEGWGERPAPGEASPLMRYVDDPIGVSRAVALGGGAVIGFQTVLRMLPGDPYGLPEGWGAIGTYVRNRRTGVGRALFAETLRASRAAGLPVLDALVRRANPAAMGYYTAMGFRPYGDLGEEVALRLDL